RSAVDSVIVISTFADGALRGHTIIAFPLSLLILRPLLVIPFFQILHGHPAEGHQVHEEVPGSDQLRLPCLGIEMIRGRPRLPRGLVQSLHEFIDEGECVLPDILHPLLGSTPLEVDSEGLPLELDLVFEHYLFLPMRNDLAW